MRERGFRLVQLWPTQEQADLLFEAAPLSGRKVAQFLLHFGLEAARKELAKKNKIPS